MYIYNNKQDASQPKLKFPINLEKNHQDNIGTPIRFKDHNPIHHRNFRREQINASQIKILRMTHISTI